MAKSAKKPVRKNFAKPWFVYLLECKNGRLYTGITIDLEKRFAKHCAGKGAMFTRLNVPARMLGATPCRDRAEASRLEWKIKTLTPEEKRVIAKGWAVKRLPIVA